MFDAVLKILENVRGSVRLDIFLFGDLTVGLQVESIVLEALCRVCLFDIVLIDFRCRLTNLDLVRVETTSLLLKN